MFKQINASDDEDSIDNNIIIQRSNNTEYDSDESSKIPKLQTRPTWDSSSSKESNEYMSDSNTDEDEKIVHPKYNIKKQFKNLKLAEMTNNTKKTLKKDKIKLTPKQDDQAYIKVRSMKLKDKYKQT